MKSNDRPVQDTSGSGLPPSLEQHGDRQEDVLDILQIPACRMDHAGNIRYFNQAWRAYAGTLTDPAGSRAWRQMFVHEDREAAASWLTSVAGSGRRTDFEGRVLDGEGGFRWFLLSLQPYQDGRAQDTGFICIASDIHLIKLREQALQALARSQTDMLNISVDCIKLIDTDGRLIKMNRAGCIALGVPEDSSFGMEWVPLLPTEIWDAGERALSDAREGRSARFPGSSELPGRPPQFWDNMLTPVKAADGRVEAILCVSREITSERKAQKALQRSQERLAIAARVGGLGIWDYDLQHDLLHCDEGWYRIMGRDPQQPIRSITEFRPFIHPEDADRATEVEVTAADLVATSSDYGIVFRIIRPNGEIRWVRSVASVIPDDAGVARRAVGFVVDITDEWRGELALRDANRLLKEEKDSLARQILEDPLTGIANRRFLDSELARICVQANFQRDVLSIAMIDVDHFKSFNDHYGHLKGDEVLKEVAATIWSVARRSDFVARYGGEEFVVIFPGMDAPESTLLRLFSAIGSLGIAHVASPFGNVTISCGCMVFQSDGNLTPAALLKACDEALYEAKAAGRNRYVVRG